MAGLVAIGGPERVLRAPAVGPALVESSDEDKAEMSFSGWVPAGLERARRPVPQSVPQSVPRLDEAGASVGEPSPCVPVDEG